MSHASILIDRGLECWLNVNSWMEKGAENSSNTTKVTGQLPHFLRWENASKTEHMEGKKMECMQANISLGYEILKSA